jgi:hypothetical protein
MSAFLRKVLTHSSLPEVNVLFRDCFSFLFFDFDAIRPISIVAVGRIIFDKNIPSFFPSLKPTENSDALTCLKEALHFLPINVFFESFFRIHLILSSYFFLIQLRQLKSAYFVLLVVILTRQESIPA